MGTLSAPTIEELIVDVRSMLNQPSATNSNWTDEELGSWLNEGVRRYFTEVISHGEGQFDVQSDLDITANTETISLPTDCFKVKALYRKITNGYEILHYRNNITSGFVTTGASGGEMYLPYYYFRKNQIVLRPVPNFSETAGLRLEYTQFPETLVTGGDSLTTSVSPIFKDLLIMYVVYKAKLKESLTSGTNTTTLAKDNLSDLYLAFKEAITPRSLSPQAIIPFNPEI